jgi:hypothetical protein
MVEILAMGCLVAPIRLVVFWEHGGVHTHKVVMYGCLWIKMLVGIPVRFHRGTIALVVSTGIAIVALYFSCFVSVVIDFHVFSVWNEVLLLFR